MSFALMIWAEDIFLEVGLELRSEDSLWQGWNLEIENIRLL